MKKIVAVSVLSVVLCLSVLFGTIKIAQSQVGYGGSCIASSSAPTFITGVLYQTYCDLIGSLRVTLNTLISGENQAKSWIQVYLSPASPTYGGSYAAALTAKTATTAGTGPFFSICGSSSKVVKVQQINFDYTVATAGVYADPVLKKTSAATSAGTATALVKVPLNSTYGASTVNLLNFYTVLATAGTLVGTVDGQMTFANITGTVANQQASKTFTFRAPSDLEAVVLNGTAECLEGSFGTTTANAPTMMVSVKWTEE